MATMKHVGIAVMLTMRNVGIVIIAVLVLLVIAAFLFERRLPESPIPFDSKVWKQQEDTNERFRMVSDLKTKLIGSSKVEVEQMLGAPRKDLGPLPPEEYNYLLGTERKQLFDTNGVWLRIAFENDRVHAVEVWQD